jgi:hypothetical protein
MHPVFRMRECFSVLEDFDFGDPDPFDSVDGM